MASKPLDLHSSSLLTSLPHSKLALNALHELERLFRRYGPVAFNSVLGPTEFGWGFEVLSFNFPKLADSGLSTEVGCKETLGENGRVFAVCPQSVGDQTS